MRRLIESLTPQACRIEWIRIGTMFAFYVAMVAIAASLLVTRHPAKGEIMESSIAAVVCEACTLATD